MEKELLEMPWKKSNQENNIAQCGVNIAFYNGWKQENPVPFDSKVKKEAAKKRKHLREFIRLLVDMFLSRKRKPL